MERAPSTPHFRALMRCADRRPPEWYGIGAIDEGIVRSLAFIDQVLVAIRGMPRSHELAGVAIDEAVRKISALRPFFDRPRDRTGSRVQAVRMIPVEHWLSDHDIEIMLVALRIPFAIWKTDHTGEWGDVTLPRGQFAIQGLSEFLGTPRVLIAATPGYFTWCGFEPLVTSDAMNATVARLHREGTELLVAGIRAGLPRPPARDANREANTFDLVSKGEEPMAGERPSPEGHARETLSCTAPRGTNQGVPPGRTPVALAMEGVAQREEHRHSFPRKVNAARRYGDEYLRCADPTNSRKLPPEFRALREESMALHQPEAMVYAHIWVQASHFCENGGLGLFMEVVAGVTLGAGIILGIYEGVDNGSLHLTCKEAKHYFRASDYVLADPPHQYVIDGGQAMGSSVGQRGLTTTSK
jgi:hypothetical protein